MIEILVKVADVRIDCDLVLPLELRPHLTEFCVRARGRHDVVHDVNVDVIEHDTVTVTRGTRHIIYCNHRAR